MVKKVKKESENGDLVQLSRLVAGVAGNIEAKLTHAQINRDVAFSHARTATNMLADLRIEFEKREAAILRELGANALAMREIEQAIREARAAAGTLEKNGLEVAEHGSD